MPREITVSLKQREWQKPLVKAYRKGIKHGIVVAHRRAGKDRVSLFIELEVMLRDRCTVWHALPEQEQARKVVWDNITKDGERLIEAAFPPAICKREPNATEMKIELLNGSMWQLVGADRIRSLVGPNPKHVTFSEFALTNPLSRHFIRPILAENNGSELMITTPRGYNHAFELYEYAKKSPLWYSGIHPVAQTQLIAREELEELRRSTPDEIYRQEYDCDWSAANIGSVLGKWIEQAERQGRLDVEGLYEPSQPVYVVSDVGFRDASSWWFYQPVQGGYFILNNRTESGWDAADWAVELKRLSTELGYKYGRIYLPHDSKHRTWASKRSGYTVMVEEFGGDIVRVLPAMTSVMKVDASRQVIKRCKFAPECHGGLMGLRSWEFEYDEDAKVFSKEPVHNWASHYGDAYSYFASIAEEEKPPVKAPGRFVYQQSMDRAWTLDQLYEDRERESGRRGL